MLLDMPEVYKAHPFWSETIVQIYIGLSPDQARYLSMVDNDREKDTQIEDTGASKIEVRNLQLLIIAITRITLTIVPLAELAESSPGID